MTDIVKIFDDQRTIDAIWLPDNSDGPSGWCVSAHSTSAYKCDEIRAYRENGQMDHVPFFAVFIAGEVVARVPASMVEVRYKIRGSE